MRDIDVSIIIPVYNVEDYVAECLQSVMAQTADCTMECIVVDDRGSDDSMAVVKRTIADYNGPVEFRIITREVNGGLSAARNTGIRAARGRYVYFLDSDDIIVRDCVSSLLAVADMHPGVEIVTGDFQTFPEKNVYRHLSLQGKNFPEYSENKNWIRSVFLTKYPIIACNKLISRIFIIENNLYFKEGILHEDNHWHAMAYHVVGKIAFVDRILYMYRMRFGSITQSEDVALRRINNMGVICREMFAKEVSWDRPWAKWVFDSLCQFKFSINYKPSSELTKKVLGSCALIVSKNKSCPLPMRMLFRYFTFPRPFFSATILHGVFIRLLRYLPECN